MKLLSREVLYGNIFLITNKTFYSRFGDLLIIIYCGIVFILTFFYLILKKIKKFS